MGCVARGLHEKNLNFKLSGNQVYYTMFKTLLVNTMLCCKYHCQRVSRLKVFSYEGDLGLLAEGVGLEKLLAQERHLAAFQGSGLRA